MSPDDTSNSITGIQPLWQATIKAVCPSEFFTSSFVFPWNKPNTDSGMQHTLSVWHNNVIWANVDVSAVFVLAIQLERESNNNNNNNNGFV